jgi:hypothetical protein
VVPPPGFSSSSTPSGNCPRPSRGSWSRCSTPSSPSRPDGLGAGCKAGGHIAAPTPRSGPQPRLWRSLLAAPRQNLFAPRSAEDPPSPAQRRRPGRTAPCRRSSEASHREIATAIMPSPQRRPAALLPPLPAGSLRATPLARPSPAHGRAGAAHPTGICAIVRNVGFREIGSGLPLGLKQGSKCAAHATRNCALVTNSSQARAWRQHGGRRSRAGKHPKAQADKGG